MFYFLPPFIRGILTFALYVAFTVALSLFLFAVAIVKFLSPFRGAKLWSSKVTDWIASGMWVRCAIWTHRLTGRVIWETSGLENVCTNRWCLIVSNHQSWVDILVLVHVLAGKVPPYKFFIKKELLWVPFFGQCLWAMDYPVMKRYSKEFLRKNPHLKGRDLETAKKSCEKFKEIPVTVINFVEGTRRTPEKQSMQDSPFRHLLRPRAGGLAMTIYAMGELLENMVDITIAFPEGAPGLWEFFCGKVSRVKVEARILDIPDEFFQAGYFTDNRVREPFNKWLNKIWEEKDETLDKMIYDKDHNHRDA
ncbi:MAG: acyltransferase [Desulfobacterales bacterium]